MSAIELSIQEARAYVDAWRNLTKVEKGDAMNELKAWLIPHDAVHALFADDVYAIRTYLGYDGTNNEVKLIVVGTTSEVNGVFSDIINTGVGQNTKIYNFTLPCPTGCDPQSALF
ncbi:MAG: hypothetical protein RJQ00_09150 [Vicingaceae bacterium]